MIEYQIYMANYKKKVGPELEEINYRNVSLLQSFTDSTGKIIGRRQSGLPAKKQRQVKRAIRQARALGLII